MIFFMAVPFLAALANLIMPQQIGSRDVAFPFMNFASLLLTTAGAGLVLVSLVIGKFSMMAGPFRGKVAVIRDPDGHIIVLMG